jgi:hypothetical protein
MLATRIGIAHFLMSPSTSFRGYSAVAGSGVGADTAGPGGVRLLITEQPLPLIARKVATDWMPM